MTHRARTILLHHGGAVLLTALALTLRSLLDPWLGEHLPFVTFFVAVAVAAWLGGLRPALLATLLGFLSADYFFVPPRFSFIPPPGPHQFGLAMYFMVSLAFAALGEALHTARRRAEARREVLRVTLVSIGDAVIATDANGRVTFLNDTARELTGWAQDEARGSPLTDVFRIVNEQTRQPVESPVEKVFTSGQVVGLDNHTVLIARDGTERPIDDSAAPVRDGAGRLVGVVLVFRDVSDRRAAEAAQRKQQERLRLFVEHTPTAVAMLDKEMRYLLYSRRWLADFGLSDRDLRGRSHYDVFPDLPERWKEVHRRCLAGAVERAEEDSFTRPDGRTEWLRWEVRPWHDDRGEVGGLIFFSETITERKMAQQAVREQAGVLRGILAATVDHIYVVGRGGRYRHVSTGGARVLGFEPHEVVGKDWRELGLPAEVMEPFDARREVALRSGEPTREEVVFRTPQGEERRFEYVVAPIAGEGGRTDAVVVVSRDVTERAEGEARLRRIVESNMVGLLVADFTDRILDANDEFLRLAGYTRDDLRAGRLSFLDLTPPEYRHLDERAMAEMTATGRHAPFEKEYVRKDGSRVPVLVGTAYLGKDREGKELGVGFILDLTERKRAEQAVRASEERLRLALDAGRMGV